MPAVRDELERRRRARRGDVDRRVRLLQRRRDQVDVVQVVELTVVAEVPRRQEALDDPDRLLEARLALLLRDVVAGVLVTGAAAPEADFETSAADLVEHRDVLSQPNRMV